MKPQILVTPKKGKLIGAKDNEGLCDTLEWMKNVCNNFKGDGMTVEVDRTDEDVPIIRLSDGVMQTLENIEENGGGGGGGECDCDITPYYEEGSDNVKIATWTNGDVTKDIYAPTNDNNVQELYEYISNTPFWFDKNNRMIKNCYFYDGRKFVQIANAAVRYYGTYYLKVEVSSGGTRSYSIQVDAGQTTVSSAHIENTDTTSYFKLWTISPTVIFDWRGTIKLPFYSE